MKSSLPACLLFAFFVAVAGAGESGHDRYIAKVFEQLKDELLVLSHDPNPNPGKLADIQKRMDQLEKETFDLTKGESGICPVHHIKMQIKETQIAFGLLAVKEPQPDSKTRETRFPFARDWIVGGCIVSDGSPKTGKVFLCPKCVGAEKAWMKAHEEK